MAGDITRDLAHQLVLEQEIYDYLPTTGGNMAVTNTATGAGDQWYVPPTPWTDDGTAATPYPTWGDYLGTHTPPTPPPPPDTKEAITILEEAEYELKELLKKASSVAYPVMINGKTHLDLIEIALRDVQKALRTLLKVG